MDCENCAYFAYDEEYEEYFCTAVLDEDEVYRISQTKKCPYFRDGDEYKIVRKQNWFYD